MTPDNDLPTDIRAYDPELERIEKERAESRLRLSRISVGNRFRLMFGQSLLPERDSHESKHQDQKEPSGR